MANYTGVNIRTDLVPVYWAAAYALQREYYSSIERFDADIFTPSSQETTPTMTSLLSAEIAAADVSSAAANKAGAPQVASADDGL